MTTENSAGVIAQVREGLGLAKILVRKNAATALAQQVQTHFQCALPTSPRRTCGNDIAVMGIAPGSWLAMRENSGNDFASALKPILGTFAAISDQSDAYCVFRLRGPHVRAALSKLVPIDIHDRAFKEGDVAETIARYVRKLVELMCTELETQGLGARRLDLLLHRVDNRIEAIRIGTALPVRDVKRLTRLLCDKIEKIAIFAGRGIGPLTCGAGAVLRPREPDIEAAAGRVVDIAHEPVATVAAAVGEIVTAHGLGMAREVLRQFGGLTGHERLLMPLRVPRFRGDRCGRADDAR